MISWMIKEEDMLVKSDNSIHIDHIMWQPQFKCQSKCKGCYLRKSKAAQYQGPLNYDIINLVFVEEEITCNQFTISLDTIYKIDNELLEQIKWIWQYYHAATNSDIETATPQLCITVENWNTVIRWANAMDISIHNFLEPLCMLSISKLPTLGKKCEDIHNICREAGTELNFNKLVKKDMDDLAKKIFRIQCRYVDNIYLVFKKSPLGIKQDPDMVDHWLQALSIAADEAGLSKLCTDICIRESHRKIKNNLTCSACIGKISVWPDGSVTGCPYDTNYLGSPQTRSTREEIKQVITSKDNHPMKFCTIPEMLEEIEKDIETQ